MDCRRGGPQADKKFEFQSFSFVAGRQAFSQRQPGAEMCHGLLVGGIPTRQLPGLDPTTDCLHNFAPGSPVLRKQLRPGIAPQQAEGRGNPSMHGFPLATRLRLVSGIANQRVSKTVSLARFGEQHPGLEQLIDKPSQQVIVEGRDMRQQRKRKFAPHRRR